MNIDFTPFVMVWALLGVVVVLMAGYRKAVSVNEDEMLHLGSPMESTRQVTIAHKLDAIDKWGKLLTAITATYGLLLAIAYTYQTWIQATTLGIE